MRKFFIFTLLAVMAVSADIAFAQQKDWARFSRYESANAELTSKPRAVLFGDSITDVWAKKCPDFFKENDFVGRGISGQTTSQMLVRFRRDVVDLDPKYVVILAGTNDLALNNGYISPENILGNIISMCEIARANKIKPILSSLLPAAYYGWRKELKDVPQMIINLNEMIKEYARSEKIPYVDYHSLMKDADNGLIKELGVDAVHPNVEGYKIMQDILMKVL